VGTIVSSKKCVKCNTEKPRDCFHSNFGYKDGLYTYCKNCVKIGIANKAKKNSQRLTVIVPSEKYCPQCDGVLSSNKFNKNKRNTDGLFGWCKSCCKIWTKTHRQIINKNEKDRLKLDSVFRLKKYARNRIKRMLRGKRREKHMAELVGLDGEAWMNYLETLFWPGMTRENYGAEWDVDHIKPLSHFNLLDIQEHEMAFNYKNTQPLWKTDNYCKGSRLDWTPDESKYEKPKWWLSK
jgi:hypothetical protein